MKIATTTNNYNYNKVIFNYAKNYVQIAEYDKIGKNTNIITISKKDFDKIAKEFLKNEK